MHIILNKESDLNLVAFRKVSCGVSKNVFRTERTVRGPLKNSVRDGKLYQVCPRYGNSIQ